jgi:protein arginine N-methyltransferase 1
MDDHYDVTAYATMMGDRRRVAAYKRAIERAVKPGDVVAELGTGTGFKAFFALQAGAKKVYAVEPADSIVFAQQAKEAAGIGDELELLHGLSTDLVLPERVDVIVSDMRGVLPLFSSHLPSIVDARERLLAPGGTLIARRDTLRCALVYTSNTWDELVGVWDDNPAAVAMDAARRACACSWTRARPKPEHMLSTRGTWGELDYRTLTSPHVGGDVELVVENAGEAHGFSVWFDSELDDEDTLSSAPDAPQLAYDTAFFPLPQKVEVAAGDRVELRMSARYVEHDYVFRWRTTIYRAGGASRFDQSTFEAAPLSMSILENNAGEQPVALTADSALAVDAVTSVGEGQTPIDVAARLQRDNPERFANASRALGFVLDAIKPWRAEVETLPPDRRRKRT